MDIRVLILAAGEGTRMRSQLPKVCHSVAGLPILHRVIHAMPCPVTSTYVMLGRTFSDLSPDLAQGFPGIHCMEQKERLGTGHAVQCAMEQGLPTNGYLLVVPGDLPLLRQSSVQPLVDAVTLHEPDAVVLAFEPDNPTGYGRILTENGAFTGIVEERDASPDQRLIRSVNTGIYLFNMNRLPAYLDRLNNENAQGEYYLTDIPGMMADDGNNIAVVHAPDPIDFLGVNTRVQLAEADSIAIHRKHQELMLSGVTLLNPASIRIEESVSIGPDTVIHPNCHLTGTTTVGNQVVIEQGVVIRDSAVGNGTRILPYSVIQDADIGDDCAIGPMAHLRPGSRLARNVKVGNFVETKKVRLEEGVKASHLTYLGDAEVGTGANIGAGTITCNYDGKNKHLTRIGKGAFIGSDTQLVAPVTVGDGAYVGAGSTITKDVPGGALAISRTRQTNIPDWAARKDKS